MKGYQCAVVSRIGKRKNNEDNFLVGTHSAAINHSDCMYVCEGALSKPIAVAVADGMGGEAHGELASYCAVETLKNDLQQIDSRKIEEILRGSIDKANDAICIKARDQGHRRMGSTIVAAVFYANSVFFVGLGDSRLYCFRNGCIKQLTKDHTEGQMLLDAGMISAEAANSHPGKNRLTRYLGMDIDGICFEAPNCKVQKLKKGDVFLLCSDGVSGVLGEDAIVACLTVEESIKSAAEKLVEAALQKGGTDNTTAVLIRIEANWGVSIKRFLRKILAMV